MHTNQLTDIMKTAKFATRYEILRGVASTGRQPCAVQPKEKPVRVALLLDEKKFLETGGLLKHHSTVFLDDAMHDWDWRRGLFFYHSHALGVEDVGDVLVVYETEERVVQG